MPTATPFSGSSGLRALSALSLADRQVVEQARIEGRLSETQAQAAVHAWRNSSTARSFGGFLAELHYCTERQLSGWLAKAHQLPELRGVELMSIAPEVGRILNRTIATARCALPVRKGLGVSGGITVVVADPGEPQLSQVGHALEQYGKVSYCVAPRKDILEAIERVHRPRDSQASNAAALLADDQAINRYVEELFRRAAIELRASDLHIVPEASTYEIRVRINGYMETLDVIPCDAALKARMASGFKLASGRGSDGVTKLPAGIGGALDVLKTLVPQDGNGMREYGSRTFTLRFSTSPCIKGESIVIRFLDLDAQIGTLGDLGMLLVSTPA
jgi:type II secretory ATPase GspE/PulE/Tfp pilus assembly ATPase PilB-like protein